MSNKTASARKNGDFGYKAVVKYTNGRTHIPVRKNFKTRDEAVAYARRWIEANDTRRNAADNARLAKAFNDSGVFAPLFTCIPCKGS